MKIKDRAKPKVPPVEAGVYMAVCVGFIDLGEQYSEKFKNYSYKCLYVWELPGETVEDKIRVFEEFLSRSDEGLHAEGAYPSGLYLDGTVDYSIGGLLEREVSEILLQEPPAPGELRRVETEDGVRFIMGYPLVGAAYDSTESSVFFSSFYEDVAEIAVTERAYARLDEVKVDMGEHKLDMYTIPYNDKNLSFCVVK